LKAKKIIPSHDSFGVLVGLCATAFRDKEVTGICLPRLIKTYELTIIIAMDKHL